MSSKILICVTHFEKDCRRAKSLFDRMGYELILNKGEELLTDEEMMKYGPQVDGIVAGCEIIGEDLFRVCPKLKIVARFGIGYDTVDIEKAKERHIYCTNVRTPATADSVSEMALALLLDIVRGITPMNNLIKMGVWERKTGFSFRDKTVGILGFGAIGQALAERLTGFGLREIVAYDTYPNREAAEHLGVRMVTLQEALNISDMISLHIPNTPETHYMMNRDTFAAMKPGSYFVNTARGGLVDPDALYEALKNGHLAGAATDVYEIEPPKEHLKFFNLDNMICTPHAASETAENIEALGEGAAQAIVDVLEGKEPENWLNPWE
ncbi:phosphoglycerate dehydrogenase [Marispirochaeta sp.]|uniref:phosphoglycerate dehydrogenase n=1 Tax=Marispirochaeta sp. TaxID=2038653 RepID=UPI0029C769A1|nr:phosphoglycerate dehydrogenase [Marispirochaeta sp.]